MPHSYFEWFEHGTIWHNDMLKTEISCTCLPLNAQGDFYRQSLADFVPFRDLSVWDAQRAKNHCRVQGEACFVVQIQDGQIYILDEKMGFQSRDLLAKHRRNTMAQQVASHDGRVPKATD